MKHFKIYLLVMAAAVLLAACSSDEEKPSYMPMVASAMNATVYVEVIDGDKAVSPTEMLYECRFSVFGQASKRTKNVTAEKLNGTDVFCFWPDLPDFKVMKFWETDEGRRGEGYSDATITVDGVKTNLRFHFEYSALPNADKMLGGNSLDLKTVEWRGKSIDPLVHGTQFKIVLRKQGQGFSVE